MKKTKRIKSIFTTSMATAVLTMAFAANAFAASSQSIAHKELIMKVGESKAYVDSNEVTSSSAPILIDNTTYVPLGFVSEYFECFASYDSKSNKVTIVADGNSFTATVGESQVVSSDGTMINLGANVQIKDDTILIPIRGIVENILNKEVSFMDSLIFISDDLSELDHETLNEWNAKWENETPENKSSTINQIDCNQASIPSSND